MDFLLVNLIRMKGTQNDIASDKTDLAFSH